MLIKKLVYCTVISTFTLLLVIVYTARHFKFGSKYIHYTLYIETKILQYNHTTQYTHMTQYTLQCTVFLLYIRTRIIHLRTVVRPGISCDTSPNIFRIFRSTIMLGTLLELLSSGSILLTETTAMKYSPRTLS